MDKPLDTTQRETSRPEEHPLLPDPQDPEDGWTSDLHPPRTATDSTR